MKISRRDAMKAGLVGMTSLATARCTSPAYGAKSSSDLVTVEMRFKGTFAFMRDWKGTEARVFGPDGITASKSLAAVHRADMRHDTHVLVDRRLIADVSHQKIDDLWDSASHRQRTWLRFREPMSGLNFGDIRPVPLKRPTSRSALMRLNPEAELHAADWCPSGALNDGMGWIDPTSIASLARLYPGAKPLDWAKPSVGGFYMPLPKGTDFFGRPPLDENLQKAIWEFKTNWGKGSARGIRQAITDVVATQLRMPRKVTLTFRGRNGTQVSVPMDFSGMKNPIVWVISRPVVGPPPDGYPDGFVDFHFGMMSDLVYDPNGRMMFDVLPVRLAQDCIGTTGPVDGGPPSDSIDLTDPSATDIRLWSSADVFCPGGDVPNGP